MKKIKEALEEFNRAADEHADKGLEEARKSRWTGALVILIGAFAIGCVVAGLAYLF